MSVKPSIAALPITDLLRERRSPRAFAPGALDPEEILSILEAARWAPSAGNGQPWSFLIAPRADEETYARLLGCLNEGNQIWAQRAPLLILTIARLVRDNGQPSTHAFYDLGQAVAHLTVQAAALGLYVRQMGGFSVEQARTAFAIPDDHAPATVIAVGRLGDPAALPEQLQAREAAARQRKPLEAFVFGRGWGVPPAVLE